MLDILNEAIKKPHLLVVHEVARRWIDVVRGCCVSWPVRVQHSARNSDSLQLIREARECTLLVGLGPRPVQSCELVEEAASLGRGVAIVVIARSDHAPLEAVIRELGADAFLCEPLSVDEFAEMLGSILSMRLAQVARRLHAE